LFFEVSQAWKDAYPGAAVGVLAMHGVLNPAQHAGLELEKNGIVENLRAQFAGQDRTQLEKLPVLHAYADYYKRFKKTYHVQLQLESILWKDKTIPSVAALVEAMFMAEVKNMLLTAGHDRDSLLEPVRLDVASGTESYTLMRGQPQTTKVGDMIISDHEGVISSIIYGPDQRTQIRETTRSVLFTVYAPPGIALAAVQAHLDDIERYVRLVSPDAVTDWKQVLAAQ
jgi:DNA/RNA-binding domain of Phe-tRNA-synthetase-like protein